MQGGVGCSDVEGGGGRCSSSLSVRSSEVSRSGSRASRTCARAGECCNLALFLLPFAKSHAASSFDPAEALTVT